MKEKVELFAFYYKILLQNKKTEINQSFCL